VEQLAVVVGHVFVEPTQGADDDAVLEAHVTLGQVAVVFGLGPVESARDRLEHLAHRQALVDVQLRREAHLDVADILGEVVEGQFVGDAFEVFGLLHHRDGVGEPREVIGQVLVLLFEHDLQQTLGGGGGEVHLFLGREFDQGRQTQRAVKVEMQVGFRDAFDEGLVG